MCIDFKLTSCSANRMWSKALPPARSWVAFSFPRSVATTRSWASRAASLVCLTVKEHSDTNLIMHDLGKNSYSRYHKHSEKNTAVGPRGKHHQVLKEHVNSSAEWCHEMPTTAKIMHFMHLPSLKSLFASSKTSLSLLLDGLSRSSLFSVNTNKKIHQHLVNKINNKGRCPSQPVRSVGHSRCIELIRSLYLLRIFFLSALATGSLLSSCRSVEPLSPPSSSSLSCWSPLLGREVPFCPEVSLSSAPLLLFMFSKLVSDLWGNNAWSCAKIVRETTETIRLMVVYYAKIV